MADYKPDFTIVSIEFVSKFCKVCKAPDASHILTVKPTNFPEEKWQLCGPCVISTIAKVENISYGIS